MLIYFYFLQFYFIYVCMEDPYNDGTSILDLIKNRGYPVETYSNLKTEDNYLLDMHRIPYGKNNDSKILLNRPPILLVHPFSGSGELYVVLNDSIAFQLADAGFDVWICHTRGSKYSRKHSYIRPITLDSPYWSYSWHEKGYYDLPVFIDLILKTTGMEEIFIFGYSEGSSDIFVLLSDKPEYNSKIKLAINVGPGILLGHTSNNYFQTLARHLNEFQLLVSMTNFRGLYFDENLLRSLVDLICGNEYYLELCGLIFYVSNGLDVKNYKDFEAPLSEILVQGLQGASVNELIHYAQLIKSNKFQHFDHGPLKNIQLYGSTTPPPYNIKNIKCPVAVIYAVNDWYTSPVDVEKLINSLPNVIFVHKFTNEKISHSEYMYRNETNSFISNAIVNLANKV